MQPGRIVTFMKMLSVAGALMEFIVHTMNFYDVMNHRRKYVVNSRRTTGFH